MSNFYFGNPPFINYTIDSWTNVDSDYPASNAKEKRNISKQVRTSDTTGSVFVIDLESTYSNLIIAIDHVNFTSFQLEVDDASDFATCQITSSATILANDWTCWYENVTKRSRYKHIWKVTGTNLRYIRGTIANQTATNSASYHFVGRILVTDQILTLSQNMNWNLTYNSELAWGERTRKSGGKQKYALSSYKIMNITMGWDAIDKNYISDIQTLDMVRPDQPIIVWNNELSDTAEYYVMSREDSNVDIQWGGPYHRQIGNMGFREVVADD